MFFLAWFILSLSVVIAFVIGLPSPITTKIGLGMILQSVAMVLGAGFNFGYAWVRGVWQETEVVLKANCLVWRHPDNTPSGMASLELAYYPDRLMLEARSQTLQQKLVTKRLLFSRGKLQQEIKKIDSLIKNTLPLAGPDWFYKYFWFMSEKRLKWMYEQKQGNGTYKMLPYNPDAEINKKIKLSGKENKEIRLPTAGELGAALDTTVLKRIEKRRLRNSTMEKMATGAIIATPLVCLLAIMMLSDMLKQGGL